MPDKSAKIVMSSRYEQNWQLFSGVHVIGAIHNGSRWIYGKALAETIAVAIESENIQEVLGAFNGSFAFIASHRGKLIAAVDWMRSYPLFWTETPEGVCVGNNAWELTGAGRRENWNELAVQEFSMAGFVSGNETLLNNLYQLQAGQWLQVNETGSTEVSFWDTEVFADSGRDESLSLNQAMEKLEAAYEMLSFRLVDFLNGRQAVVPLSGGHDSRCILWMLYKRGYKNVFTFTYGRKNNYEAEVAEKVAAALGYPWQFIEYAPQMWQSLYNDDPEFQRFSLFAGNLCSLPHESDFFALKQLRDKKMLSEDVVFLPGSTPLATSQIMQRWDTPMKWTNLHNRIYESFYGLSPDISSSVGLRFCRKRIPLPENIDQISPERFFETWYWRNAETKIFFNSQRSFEYFGCKWHLPLADRYLMKLYATIPSKYYRQKIIFNRFVERISRQCNLPARKDPPPDWRKKIIKKIISFVGLGVQLRRLINRRNRLNHPLCYYDVVPKSQWHRLESMPDPGQHFGCNAALESMMTAEKNRCRI